MTKKEIFDIAVEIERLTSDPYSFCEKFLNVDGNRRQKSIEQWQFNAMVSRIRESWDFKQFKDNEYYRKLSEARALGAKRVSITNTDIENFFTND